MTTTFEPPVHDRDRATGAVSVRGRPVRKAPLAWVPWVALALIGVLTLATLLIGKHLADEDGPAASGAAATTATTAPADPAAPPPAPVAPGESAVVAGGRALLPLPGAGLASLVGQGAEGRGVNVQSVVADEGFWIGDDTTNRIFVFLTDEAKAAKGESPFQVKAGQRVDFGGTVKAIPDDLPPFGLQAAEGAEQLRQQGHYIEVTRIALSA
jgi:hypothetical protein